MEGATNEKEQPFNGKERNTLIKLIQVLAVEGYRYDPALSRSRRRERNR